MQGPGLGRGIIKVSPSTVAWLRCLRKFHNLAVDRVKMQSDKQSPNLKFGNMMHECLRALYDPVNRATDLNLDTLLRLSCLRAGYKQAQERNVAMERARKMINTYRAQADIEEEDATIAVEQYGTVPVKVGGVVLYALSARIDRVLRLGDASVVAIDYKLSTHSPDLDAVLISLVVLKSIYPGAKRYQCWIDCLTEDKVTRTVFCSADFRGAIHLLTARVRRYLAATEYPGEPSELCEWCPLRPNCEESVGQRPTDVNDLDF